MELLGAFDLNGEGLQGRLFAAALVEHSNERILGITVRR